MGRIQDLWLKIKNGTEDAVGEWGLIAIVFLVGLASFGLGRLSALQEAQPAVSVQGAEAAAAAISVAPSGLVVASRSGTAYHFPWCSGAQSIKESNKIWFESEGAAQWAGYRPAKNCKGLE
jgi:hypothetical protein